MPRKPKSTAPAPTDIPPEVVDATFRLLLQGLRPEVVARDMVLSGQADHHQAVGLVQATLDLIARTKPLTMAEYRARLDAVFQGALANYEFRNALETLKERGRIDHLGQVPEGLPELDLDRPGAMIEAMAQATLEGRGSMQALQTMAVVASVAAKHGMRVGTDAKEIIDAKVGADGDPTAVLALLEEHEE